MYLFLSYSKQVDQSPQRDCVKSICPCAVNTISQYSLVKETQTRLYIKVESQECKTESVFVHSVIYYFIKVKNKELITWVWARTGSMRRKALFQRRDTQKTMSKQENKCYRGSYRNIQTRKQLYYISRLNFIVILLHEQCGLLSTTAQFINYHS